MTYRSAPSPNKVVVDLTEGEAVPPKQEWAMVRSNVRLVSCSCGLHLTCLGMQAPMNHNNGSTMDVDVVQDEQLNKAIAESLAMSTTVEEVEEMVPPEAWVRKDNK